MLAVAIDPALEELGYVLRKNIPIIVDRDGHHTADAQPPLHVLLGNLLAGIADRLDHADIDELADPPDLAARRRHGNLEFAEEIGGARVPSVATMLAFQLEFYMRAFVAGRPFAPHPFDTPTGNMLHGKPHRDVAATMKGGKPHRDLIAIFVKATFPKSALNHARAIEDRITDLIPRVVWLGDFH